MYARDAPNLHGKEGVDGSSPSEGSAKTPETGAFSFRSTCSESNVLWVSTRLWSFQVQLLLREPGSPWENLFVESFNGKLRDEFFAREIFDTVMEARILHRDYTHTYNHHRPHSALGYMTPAAFAAAWTSGKSITPNPSPWNGLQRPGQDVEGIQDLVAISSDPLPSAAVAILMDGPIAHQQRSGTSTK